MEANNFARNWEQQQKALRREERMQGELPDLQQEADQGLARQHEEAMKNASPQPDSRSVTHDRGPQR